MTTAPRTARRLATPSVWLGFVTAALLLATDAAAAQTAGAGGPPEGGVRLAREPDRTYRSIALALDAARDGDVLELGPGTFGGPIEVTGKDVELRGAGADRTEITASGTVVQVAADGRARLAELSITAKGGGPFAPAILAVGDGFRLVGCVVRGASGFGVEVRGAGHDVELYGNTVRGNGGGVRFTSALGRLHSNVIVDNAGPGVLVDGTPPEEGVLVMEHNTVIRNAAAGGAPVAATGPGGPDAVLTEALQHRLAFFWNVASGRLTEKLLTPESLAELQTRNVLVWPAKVEDVFEDVEEGDYRPDDELPVDPAGLELGALLSEDARDRLAADVDAALAEGRLAAALTLARRAAGDERDAVWQRVKETLYRRYAGYLEARQPGLAVRDFFLALPGAPRGWDVSGRFSQALKRIASLYGQAVDWNGVFPDRPTRKAALLQLVTDGALRPGRPTTASDGDRWTVVARETKDLLLDRHREPLRRTLTLGNPEHADVVRSLEIERSRRTRLDEQRRKVAEEVEAYEAKHGATSKSSFLRAKRRELDRRSQAVVDAEQRIRSLEQTLEQVPKSYTVEVKGQLERTDAMAEVTLSLTDPVGRTHEEVVPFRRGETFLALEPIPMLGFEGIAPRPVADERERTRYGRELVEKALAVAIGVIEARDLERIGALVQAARDGTATEADWNELFSLVAVYADRFEDAIAGERPAAELRKARDGYPDIDRPRFLLRYDADLERRPPLRFVAETSAARRQAERLLSDLETRYAAYWGVLPGLRLLFEQIGGRSFDEFVRIVRGHEGR